jgi:segregation and condensation protein A
MVFMLLHLDNFDGPLDLLLYLIKSQEINIFNIPIFTITEQFLNFLKNTTTLDYLNAGEYLATASQLIEIKAHFLLPAIQKKYGQDYQSMEDVEETDPRKQLVEQLLEYESLQRAGMFLKTQLLAQPEIYPSQEYKRREEEFSEFEHPIYGNAFDLAIAFEKVLLRFSQQKPVPKLSVKSHKITIQQKMFFIKNKLEEVEFLFLLELMSHFSSRYELIVSLMAILELCKSRQITLEQNTLFGDIKIQRGPYFAQDVVLKIEDAL